jgi:hypothetical protein
MQSARPVHVASFYFLLFLSDCSALSLTAHPSFTKALNNEEDATAPIEEICTDSEIGSAGLRAFCAALLGKGAGMKATGYKHLKSLRLWKAGCGDAGAAAVVSIGNESDAHTEP